MYFKQSTIFKTVIFVTLTALSFSLVFSAYADGYVPNPFYSVYSTSSPYSVSGSLRNRANCYGYALRCHYADYLANGDAYMQQPAEFANKATGIALTSYGGGLLQTTLYNYSDIISIQNDMFSLEDHLTNLTTSQRRTYMEQMLFADAATLGYQIANYNSNSFPPNNTTGCRYIAMVVTGPTTTTSGGFHFYMRHDDGTWSHKNGNGNPSKYCMDHYTALTDSNIARHLKEGSYADGLYSFYRIYKDAIADWAHEDGRESYSISTGFYNTERAGDYLCAATSIAVPANITNGRFHYPGDIDYYVFTASTTKSYSFRLMAEVSSSAKMELYTPSGVFLTGNTSSNGTSTFTHTCTLGTQYIIAVSSPGSSTFVLQNEYSLTVS